MREASRRVLSLWHYDVQLIGGIALHDGRLAEMATGEGKTRIALPPVYLNNSQKAFMVTTNDYLARRDSETMVQTGLWGYSSVSHSLSTKYSRVRLRTMAI